MTQIIEFELEAPPADAWASEEAVRSLNAQEELERLTAEFLAKGGTIREIPVGTSAMAQNGYIPLRTAVPTTTKHYSYVEQLAYAQKKQAQIDKAEAEIVAKMTHALDLAKTGVQLRQLLGCCEKRMQRLLLTHFSADPRAIPFLRKDRVVTSEELLGKVQKALGDGVVGIEGLATAIGVHRFVILRLQKKYGLAIPPMKTGRKPKK